MNISSTKGASAEKLKILVYGESGVGKTQLATTLPESTLIVSAEAGLLGLNGSDIDVIDIAVDDNGRIIPEENRINALKNVYRFLTSQKARDKYSWIFIDSLTEISENLMASLYRELPERKDTLLRYGENAKRLKALIKSFRDLSYYNVVFTALASVEKDEVEARRYGPLVIGKVAQSLPAFFDEVFYMEVEETPEGPQRVLHCDKDNRFIAKDRSGLLGKKCPPNLGDIAQKIKGETSNDKARV